MRYWFCLFLMAVRGAAEISVTPPVIGVARDCSGRLHRVFGVAGAFVVEGGAGVRSADSVSARPSPQAGWRAKIPAPLPGWMVAWPYAVRVTADGAEVYRLPVPTCGGRP